MLAVKGLDMDKWMCWISLGVSGLLSVLFLLDFVLYMVGVPFLPFGGVSLPVDVVCILAGGILVYLSLDALKDIR